MDRKYLAIGGFILIAAIFVAGVIFAPSGFVSATGTTQGTACFQQDSSTLLCESPSGYWKNTVFKSKSMCTGAKDSGKPCTAYGCFCRYLPE
ncbi:MAG: hypothetical protein ABIF92_00585 [archaeon]